MVRMDTMEKERSAEWCPQLWSPEDCRYQSVEVIKWPIAVSTKEFSSETNNQERCALVKRNNQAI